MTGGISYNGGVYVTSPEADRAEGLCGGAARPSDAEPEPTEGRRCTYTLLSAVARVNQCPIPSHHIEAINPFHYLEDQEASDSLDVDTHEQEYPSAMKDAVDNQGIELSTSRMTYILDELTKLTEELCYDPSFLPIAQLLITYRR